MGKTLILAEKPSVARDIAAVLGRPVKRDGFMEAGDGYILTWALGHLAELAEPEDYDTRLKKWSVDTLPIIPESFMIKPNVKTEKQFNIVKKLLNKREVTMVINACDAAREGELIFRYIYYLARCSKPVNRLWLSESTPAAIQRALDNLMDNRTMEPLAMSAMARSQADWLVGINATRAFTVKYGQFLSIGRVQTPALALIVNREREIRSFVAKTFYELWGIFISPEGELYKGKWFLDDTDTFTDAGQPEDIKQQVFGKPGIITSVDEKNERHAPPHLFNLTDLQREANSRYGYPASKTLDLAQALYEKRKLITYPRTESRHLTTTMLETLTDRLSALGACDIYQPLFNKAGSISPGVVDDSKVTDHHAIIPTAVISDSRITGDERLIYDLVARRFLAAFFPPAEDIKTTVITTIEGHTFYSSGTREVNPGWRVVYGNDDQDPEKTVLPLLTEGCTVKTSDMQVIKKKTSPPRRYTEASLLSVMENIGRLFEDGDMKRALKQAGGLGTPATRAATIERIIKVGYIERSGKTLIPTKKGETLIDVVPNELKSPELTARWENTLSDIEAGRAGPGRFMNDVKSMVKNIIAYIS